MEEEEEEQQEQEQEQEEGRVGWDGKGGRLGWGRARRYQSRVSSDSNT